MRIDTAISATAAIATAKPELERLKKASQDVEAIFLKDLLGSMRRGMTSAESESSGLGMYKDMMDQAVATSLSKKGAMGISRMLFKDMSKTVVLEAQARTAWQNAAWGENEPEP
jgi:peptidoglycan hydrolase FlgJ